MVKAQNSRSKILTAVAGVSTESIGVTSLAPMHGNVFFLENYNLVVDNEVI